MTYRTLGRTGLQVSRLALDARRLPTHSVDGVVRADFDKSYELIRAAVGAGVNYIDTAPLYCGGTSEMAVGAALKGIRPQVMVATKVPLGEKFGVVDGPSYRRYLETSLKSLGTDYVDVHQFWSLGGDGFVNAQKQGILQAALQAKAEGVVRHLGFSFHGSPDDLIFLAQQRDFFDVAMVNHNVFDQSRHHALEVAFQEGMGLVNMGALSSPGRPENPEFRTKATTQGWDAYRVAFKLVWQNPSLATILTSFQGSLEVLKNTLAFALSEPRLSSEEAGLMAKIEPQPTY